MSGYGVFLSPGEPSTEKKLIPKKQQQLSEGAKRIAIELADTDPKKIASYIKKWDSLVSTFVNELKMGLKGFKDTELELQFIKQTSSLMKNRFGITFNNMKTGFLSEALDTNVFDCDAGSFLVYDVAKQLERVDKKFKINVTLVDSPNHAVVKTETYLFDVRKGKYAEFRHLSKNAVYHVLSYDQIQSFSYVARAIYYDRQARKLMADEKKDAPKPIWQKAIADYTKALELDSTFYDVYRNRALAYGIIGQNQGTIKDITKLLTYLPKEQDLYGIRGTAYVLTGKLDLAVQDFTTGISLNKSNPLFYQLRARVYKIMRKNDLVDKDMQKYNELTSGHQ